MSATRRWSIFVGMSWRPERYVDAVTDPRGTCDAIVLSAPAVRADARRSA